MAWGGRRWPCRRMSWLISKMAVSINSALWSHVIHDTKDINEKKPKRGDIPRSRCKSSRWCTCRYRCSSFWHKSSPLWIDWIESLKKSWKVVRLSLNAGVDEEKKDLGSRISSQLYTFIRHDKNIRVHPSHVDHHFDFGASIQSAVLWHRSPVQCLLYAIVWTSQT